jgi:hypothetical protein
VHARDAARGGVVAAGSLAGGPARGGRRVAGQGAHQERALVPRAWDWTHRAYQGDDPLSYRIGQRPWHHGSIDKCSTATYRGGGR